MSLCLEKQKIRCGMISRVARHIAIDENSGKIAVVRKSRYVVNWVVLNEFSYRNQKISDHLKRTTTLNSTTS